LFPFTAWAPLSVAEVVRLFTDAPFAWGLAGGYAVEQFLGTSIREHSDIDVAVYRDEQHRLQRRLTGWHLYAADPPGTLRQWRADELLYKARNNRPKDDLDFRACLPLLSADARQWLEHHLRLLYPEGHRWLEWLERAR
jgi:hypothetical protein